jgi:tetratricopeptide (TPR) repeat protein
MQEARAVGLDDVLARSEDVRTLERAQVLVAAGSLHLFLGQLAPSRPLLEQAIELAREVEDRRTLALAMSRLGWVRAAGGRVDEVTASLGEQAIAEARALGDPWVLAETLNDRACAYAEQGYSSLAVSLGEESLKLRRSIVYLPGVADSLNNLGFLMLLAEDYPAAVAHLQESLQIGRDLWGRDHAGVAIITRDNLAIALLLNEEPERALGLFQEILDLCLQTGDRRTGQEALIGLAGVAAETHAWGRAAWLAGAAERQMVDLVLSPGIDPRIRERFLPAARQALGDERYEEEYERGRRASFEDAVAYALNEVAST